MADLLEHPYVREAIEGSDHPKTPSKLTERDLLKLSADLARNSPNTNARLLKQYLKVDASGKEN